jgi:hypothetical protein
VNAVHCFDTLPFAGACGHLTSSVHIPHSVVVNVHCVHRCSLGSFRHCDGVVSIRSDAIESYSHSCAVGISAGGVPPVVSRIDLSQCTDSEQHTCT